MSVVVSSLQILLFLMFRGAAEALWALTTQWVLGVGIHARGGFPASQGTSVNSC